MVVISKFMIPKGYTGITLFPFIFLKSKSLKNNTVLINHEKIHLRQQIELLILPFYLWYGLEFLFRYYQHKNWFIAYKNISFEREAFANDADFQYIKNRTFWQFLKYLR